MFILPEIKSKKKPKAAYKKPDAVRDLERMADAEAIKLHPGMPFLASRTFKDNSSNGLTACIVKYITLNGGFASRISNQGTFNRRLNKYIPGTARKGLADVMGTHNGKSLHLEIKIGRDKQSDAQKKIESEVNRSGGFYFIAKDFNSFKQWFDNLK